MLLLYALQLEPSRLQDAWRRGFLREDGNQLTVALVPLRTQVLRLTNESSERNIGLASAQCHRVHCHGSLARGTRLCVLERLFNQHWFRHGLGGAASAHWAHDSWH